ncbi:MAG: FliA/WhiG family RNA polymerase sigma factor [Opitutaceae bacterium]
MSQTAPACEPAQVDESELLERYLPLVRSVVDRIKLNVPAHVDADDLYSVGIVGLIAAVKRYTPERGDTFAGYATMRIRGAILDEMRRMDWCPRRTRARSRKIKKAINEVEQRVSRAATAEEVSTALGLTPKQYAKWVEQAQPLTFIAIDQTTDGDEGPRDSLHESLADEADVTGRHNLEEAERLEILTQRIAELPDLPRKLLAMHYVENRRLAEIGVAFGLTESRICQIRARTILDLRASVRRALDR